MILPVARATPSHYIYSCRPWACVDQLARLSPQQYTSLSPGISNPNTTQQTTCHPVQEKQVTFVRFMYMQVRDFIPTRMRMCISRPAMSKYSLSNIVYSIRDLALPHLQDYELTQTALPKLQ